MSIIGVLKKAILNRRLSRKKALVKAIGRNVIFDLSTKLVFPENLLLGDNVYIGPRGFINALGGVEIMSGTIIGPELMILSANHNFRTPNYLPYDQNYVQKKVVIGENVWIGARVMILPGATIEEGAIIGAGAVVSGTIPRCAIAVGNPAKIVSYRDETRYFELKQKGKIYLEAKTEGTINHNPISNDKEQRFT